MSDPRTLNTYAEKAQDYARLTKTNEPSAELLAFVTAVPKGALVLDLGCGPGQDAVVMAQAGLQVQAIDAVPEMVALAKKAGIHARLGTFADLPLSPPFDGIWASFSLLHAPKADFPAHLAAIHASLVDTGAFHLSMKLGEGEARDSLGRSYSYYTQPELLTHLQLAGFTVISSLISEARGLAGEIEPYITVETHA